MDNKDTAANKTKNAKIELNLNGLILSALYAILIQNIWMIYTPKEYLPRNCMKTGVFFTDNALSILLKNEKIHTENTPMTGEE